MCAWAPKTNCMFYAAQVIPKTWKERILKYGCGVERPIHMKFPTTEQPLPQPGYKASIRKIHQTSLCLHDGQQKRKQSTTASRTARVVLAGPPAEELCCGSWAHSSYWSPAVSTGTDSHRKTRHFKMRVWFLSLMLKTKPVLHKLAKLYKTAQTAEITAFTTELIMLV